MHDITNFGNSQFDHFLLHPLSDLEFFDELVLDVRDNLVAECFRLGGERFFNEEAAQDPAKSGIDVADTLPPSFWLGIGVLICVSDSTRVILQNSYLSRELVTEAVNGSDRIGFDVARECLNGLP